MLIHLSRNGQTLGPYSAEQFVQMLVTGQVQHSDNMWVQSDGWEPLSNFEECFGPHEECSSQPQRMVTPGASATLPPAAPVQLNGQRTHPRAARHDDDEEGNVNLLRTMMGL